MRLERRKRDRSGGGATPLGTWRGPPAAPQAAWKGSVLRAAPPLHTHIRDPALLGRLPRRDPYIERAGNRCMNERPGGRPSPFERPSWDEYFMLQAELAKLRSNCIVKQVGAVIVMNNRQLATGYNGTPPGIKNCFEGGCARCQMRMENKVESGGALDRCLCSHAEANAIMHCAIMGIGTGTRGAVLYTTMVPCLECTKMAVTVGIRRFVYLDSYPETDHGLVADAGVEVVKMDRDRIAMWGRRLLDGYGGDCGGGGGGGGGHAGGLQAPCCQGQRREAGGGHAGGHHHGHHGGKGPE